MAMVLRPQQTGWMSDRSVAAGLGGYEQSVMFFAACSTPGSSGEAATSPLCAARVGGQVVFADVEVAHERGAGGRHVCFDCADETRFGPGAGRWRLPAIMPRNAGDGGSGRWGGARAAARRSVQR